MIQLGNGDNNFKLFSPLLSWIAERTLVEIPDEYIKAIDNICKKEKISRAEAIRRAVINFAKQKALVDFDTAVGSWKDVEIDGVAYQRQIRKDREYNGYCAKP